MGTTIKLPRALVLRCGSGKLASVLFSTHSPWLPLQIPGSQLISSSRNVLQPCSQKHSLILTPMLGTPLVVPLSPGLDKMICSQTSERMGPCLLLASTSWKLPVAKTSSLVAGNLKSIAVQTGSLDIAPSSPFLISEFYTPLTHHVTPYYRLVTANTYLW